MIKQLNALIGVVVASICGFAHAVTHEVAFNSPQTVTVSNGDELLLRNFPTEWIGYDNVILGVNAQHPGTLSGALKNNRCVHNLFGDYQEFVYNYTGEMRIKYFGKTQTLPIQWWVGNGRSPTQCSEYQDDSLEYSSKTLPDSVLDLLYSDFINLDTMDKEYVYEGNGARFRVSNLPTAAYYNVINVQVLSMDGRVLDGGVAYMGSRMVSLSKVVSNIVMQKTGPIDPTFELAFSEKRKVKLKWWISVDEPALTEIQSRSTQQGDSIETEYFFDGENRFSGFRKATIKNARNSFKDGKAPVVKKMSLLPAEARLLVDQMNLVDDFYDIHAELENGKTATVALPVPSQWASDTSIKVAHFLQNENRWEIIAVDSIVDGIAYFQTASFSMFGWLNPLNWIEKAVDAIGDCLSDIPKCGKAIYNATVGQLVNVLIETGKLICVVVDGIVTMAMEIADDLYNIYNTLVSIICGDLTPVKNFFEKASSSGWDVTQGTLDLYSIRNARIDANTTYAQMIAQKAAGQLIAIDVNSSYAGRWDTTAKNLDVVLADVINNQVNGTVRRFSFENVVDTVTSAAYFAVVDHWQNKTEPFSRYFQTQDDLLKKVNAFVETAKALYGATNLDGAVLTGITNTWKYASSGNISGACKEILGGLGFVDWTHDVINLSGYVTKGLIYEIETVLNGEFNFNPYSDLWSEKDAWLQKMSSVMTRVSLLAWLDKKQFRRLSRVSYAQVYDGMRAWLELASPIYGYNNISILANASLALFEFIHYGTENNLNDMNYGIQRNYSYLGEFSEGTGYSQYIWDEVPYVLSALQDAYASKKKALRIHPNFMNSAIHMADISRNIPGLGFVPVEVDDGCTYNPDYLVWSALYSKTGRIADAIRLAALAGKYPLIDTDKIHPMMALGVPNMLNYGPYYNNFSTVLTPIMKVSETIGNDVGMITVAAAKDTVAISMIAEDGALWMNGQGHDQQDNLSITLTSTKNGMVIMDRGYAGFGERKTGDNHFSHFYDHNVLTRSLSNCMTTGSDFDSREGCIFKSEESANQLISQGEVGVKAQNFGHDKPGIVWNYIVPTAIQLAPSFKVDMSDFLSYGGSGAAFTFARNDAPSNWSPSYLASISAKHTTTWNLSNMRTIMYYDGLVWVVDRPNVTGGVWMANSAIGSWAQTGMKLYGSGATPIGATGVAGLSHFHIQNGNRPDYYVDQTINKKGRNIFWYTMQDVNAPTYVMMYNVDGSYYQKITTDCPTGIQCFENTSRTKKVVIPGHADVYNMQTLFPDITTSLITSNVAVVAEKLGSAWLFRSVDGYMYINQTPVKTMFVYPDRIEYEVYLNGSSVFLTYDLVGDNINLPALPILLLN